MTRIVIGVIAFLAIGTTSSIASNVIADVDSANSRYLVTETTSSTPVRSLVMDPYSTQSSQYVLQPDVLVAGYTQAFGRVTDELKPKKMLVIGGGVYTFPRVVAETYPTTKVDVVEIDPALTGIAK